MCFDNGIFLSDRKIPLSKHRKLFDISIKYFFKYCMIKNRNYKNFLITKIFVS